ncbi:DUF1287 domain-containing protein [Enhygromyxa salina]|uniref:DUF1287 domain-containing protein n=1 Tax=Enhygromyxa salina TaxID=215803 RepID=A0A2S9Y6G2_9BACT|nr:DUF1287 domain-containing protein [Enhygromyxa salina]PRQ00591.1 hypothetical protein ENSA7_60860 [Enhygromyxa salina]
MWTRPTTCALWLSCSLLGSGCRANEQPHHEQPTSASQVAPSPEPPTSPPIATREAATAESALGVVDLGVFGDLDAQVQIEIPAGLEPSESALGVIDRAHAILVLYVDGWPTKVYPLLETGGEVLSAGDQRVRLRRGDHLELAPLLRASEQLRDLAQGASPPPGDIDGDGIPDPLDIDIGAIKTTLNGASYDQSYVTLPYPNGDVPRELGACTDVIVRALRNAGIDLQAELHEDIARAPHRYPMVERANDDIDHRRVRTLLPWFRAHWTALDATQPPRPGDVIFMETIASRKGPDHIGVVGDRRATDGQLLVANNWTDGYQTSFMELLGHVEVTDRFRVPPSPEHAGPIAAEVRQLLMVRGDDWDSFHGHAQRYQRDTVGGPWRAVGDAFPIVLGHAGMAWGRGLHGDGAPPGSRGPSKREGDGRSPAGVFTIGSAWGRSEASATKLQYTSESPTLRCVDDPASAHYNRIVDGATISSDWTSAEPMRRYYELAITVEHNSARVSSAGSCIFLHRWSDPDSPVTGCTAMAGDQLDQLAAWLEPGAVLVSLPTSAIDPLRRAWAIPR